MSTKTKNEPAAPAPAEPGLASDLEQLAELATLVTSARDAMSDEIVTRLSRVFSEGISLLDRLTRNDGLMRLLEVLDRPESQHLLIGLSKAIGPMSRDIATAPPAQGGIGELLKLVRDPGTQEGLRSLSLLGKYWSESMRDLHRRGVN
jgi:uncharacterized protein YjgD (DUF1641 family)